MVYTLDHSACSDSLYQLHYPGYHIKYLLQQKVFQTKPEEKN